MRSVKELISRVLSDIQARLPEILDRRGLKSFEKYAIGNSVEKQELALYVKISEFTRRGETATFIIQAQLPSNEIEMNEYMDAVNEYLEDCFLPEKAGYLDFGYSTAITDNERASTIDVFWEVTLSSALDDCSM